MTYYIGPTISDRQRQFIIGTVLGGSSIVSPKKGKNCYLSMRGKNAYWIEYKSHELKDLASPSPFLVEKKKETYFRWHSLCYPIFNEFNELFYKDGKKTVQMKALNELRDIGLAIWFLEGGRIHKGVVEFNTTTLNEEGTNVVVKYFTEVSLPCYKKQEGKGFRVIMSPTATIKFLKTIADKVPDFLLDRLEGVAEIE